MSKEKAILTRELNRKLGERASDIVASMKHIEETGQMLNDFLVPSKKMQFVNNGSTKLEFTDKTSPDGMNSVSMHDNAIYQLAGRFNLNARDLRREAGGTKWERQVFADRMNAYAQNAQKRNLLVRTVGSEAKGILSDKYRRLNTAAIFLSFLQAAVKAGSVLVDANHGVLKDYLEVIHPEIVEVPTEKNGTVYTVFGAQIRNSDFGASKLMLKVFQMNVVCLNGMVGQNIIDERHLGSRIEQTGHITFTEETMNADTKARALQVRDIMDSVYSPDNLKAEREKIIAASDIELDFNHEVKALPKAGMLQSEVELLNKALYESNPGNGLQGKNTLWKFAQGITHIANEVESADRKRELQDLASGMVADYVK